jgi:hypothetical protein
MFDSVMHMIFLLAGVGIIAAVLIGTADAIIPLVQMAIVIFVIYNVARGLSG